VLLFVPFAIEVFLAAQAAGFAHFVAHRRRIVRVVVGALLVPSGLFAYMAWLWVLRGDPLYFSHVQSHWNRHLAPPWVSVVHAFKLIATGLRTHSTVTVANESIEIVFTALMIAVLVAACWRLRPSYTAYMALSIIVPMSTSSLMSMQRFALVLFPMFAVLALWGGRSWVNSAIVAFSLPLLGLFTVLFANWYWVA
jgi:asparagine N-glycosylation enzyme membrane subunit Stt3